MKIGLVYYSRTGNTRQIVNILEATRNYYSMKTKFNAIYDLYVLLDNVFFVPANDNYPYKGTRFKISD